MLARLGCEHITTLVRHSPPSLTRSHKTCKCYMLAVKSAHGMFPPDSRSHAVCAGVVDCQAGSGSVELRRYPSSHAFAQLQGSDNIIAFTTQRYNQQPLIIRCTSPAH